MFTNVVGKAHKSTSPTATLQQLLQRVITIFSSAPTTEEQEEYNIKYGYDRIDKLKREKG